MTLPAELRRSVTWDQGKEMSRHKQFTVATGINVYFCDPTRPGSAARTRTRTGLLRQYMPKHTDMSTYSAKDLERIQQSSMDGRARPSAT
jgi:transposase, IS30 family